MGNWRRATYCKEADCIEAGSWRKSTHSVCNGACIEAGHGDAEIGVRDTRDYGTGPVLTFTPQVWREFVTVLKETPWNGGQAVITMPAAAA